MASSSKRKRVVLSIEDKLTVCDLVRKKVPYSEIMNQFHIGKSTISDIVRNEEKFKMFKQSKSELGISKAMKTSKAMKVGMFDKLDQALYLWFRQLGEKGLPVTGPISLEKANKFHLILYLDNPKPFSGSYGFQWTVL